MDKAQAINQFWNDFELPAYDENSVPDDAKFPYITYSVTTDSLDRTVYLYGSLWYRDTSWTHISRKLDEISRALYISKPYVIKLDNGYLWLAEGSPFAQRMNDPSDDMIKRININLQAEFLTAY